MGISKALVVDDSRLARVALTKLLTKRGLDVDTAASGGEALDYLREGSPDVVFIDYMMADMDGFQAAEAINRLRGTGAMPMVMYTSQDTPEDRRRAKELGICGFLTKPTSEEGLDTVLDEVDDWHAAASELTMGAGTEDDTDSDLTDETLADLTDLQLVKSESPVDSGFSAQQKPVTSASDRQTPAHEREPRASADQPGAAASAAAAPENSEQRIRQIADQVARDALDRTRGEWQQQFHELAIELQETTTEAATLASREASDRMAQDVLADLHQEWDRIQGELHQASVSGAEKVARGIADSVARDAAGDIAESTARHIATQLVEEFANQFEGGVLGDGQNADLDAQVSTALQSAVRQLDKDAAFQNQVVEVVSDQGVPLLKNALDHWVRKVAREAAEQAVRDAVIRGTEALVQEVVVASAQAAARESRKLHRKGWIIGGIAWLVLAAGVGVALLFAI